MKGHYWIIGFIVELLIVALVIFESTEGKGVGLFFVPSGVLLVVLGTIATAFIAWPPDKMISYMKSILLVVRKPVEPSADVVAEVVRLANATGGDLRALESSLASIRHPFLRDGVQLLLDRIDEHHLEFILKERIKQNRQDYDSLVLLLKGLAKYPPALGMIGTLVGLVAMMRGLGSSAGAGSFGTAMAIGLVTSFYGIALSNLLIMPMADNISFKSARELHHRTIIMKGIMLLKQQESIVIVQETLNSMVKFSERIDVIGLGGNTSNSKSKAA
jgi:chemotaxis protein MotA